MFRVLLLILVLAPSFLFADAFVVAKVSDNPKKHYQDLKPIADYLAAELGFSEGQVVLASDNLHMIQLLEDNQVHLVSETLLSAIEFRQRSGAQFIGVKWKKGVGSYRSIIFANQEIDQLSDLVGKTIAFEDAGSTSSFFLPFHALISEGYKMQRLSNPRQQPAPNRIGYVFTDEEINSTILVKKNIVSAGACSDQDWQELEELHGDLKILHETQAIPRSIELVNPGMDDELKQRLVTLLAQLETTVEGRELLYSYQGATKFEPWRAQFDHYYDFGSDILEAVSAESR